MDKAHLTAEALGDFAEGLMPPAERRQAEAHLADCAECRREAAALQAYFREVSALGTLKAPDRFLTKVHARIDRASPWRRLLADLSSPRLLPVPLMGLAALLVGVYFAFLSPRVAEHALSETRSVSAPPAPSTSYGPTVRRAEKGEQRAEPAAEPPQAGASGNAAGAPPSQVAMAPTRPPSPVAAAPEAGKRAERLAKAKGSGRAPASKAAPSPKADAVAPGSDPAGTGALALGQAGGPEGRREENAGGQGAIDKDRKLAEPPVGWQDNPTAVYIMGNPEPAGSDAIRDRIASSPGASDRLEDSPAPAAPAAKAESAPGDKADAPVAEAKAQKSGSAPRLSDRVAAASADSEAGNERDPKRVEDAGYSAPTASRRGRNVTAAPPAATPKPWAPLGYSLKAEVGEAALRKGLDKLGVKVLRRDDLGGGRYELEVPASRVIDLEAYLGGLGALTSSPQPPSGKQNGAPRLLTLAITAP